MLGIQEKSQSIGQFLDWLLNTKGRSLGRWPRPDECTRCGHKGGIHDEACLTNLAEDLVDKLDLTPAQKKKLTKKLIREVPQSTAMGCSSCGTSGCPSFAHDEEHLIPEFTHITTLLAEYFGIDEKKAEEERRALLEYVRSQQRS